MCFHPIKIRNPSLLINEEFDKPYIEVPCGHCEQCLKNKINDLVVRSYYEWQRTKSLGGFAYFDTLTYSDESVPKLYGEMVFSRSHLTLFFKRLRKKLERAGYQVTHEVSSGKYESLLKYLVTTEYGEDDRYTKRPHYHVLWFVSIPNISVIQFYNFVRQVWTYEMKFGWNDRITDVMSHVINRLDGIQYVVKYLEKSSKYVDRLQRLLDKYKDEPMILWDILDNVKNIKPFYRSSIGFGKSIMDVSYFELSNYGVPIYSSSGLQFYPIPKYVKYKLHYDKVPHPIKEGQKLLKRNDKGIDYLISHLDEVIEAKTLQYKNILENQDIFNDTYENVKERVLTLLNGRSIKDFIIYKSVYKGHLFQNVPWSTYQHYYKRWLTSERNLRVNLKKDIDAFLADRKHRIIDENSRYDFYDFDKIDALFDALFVKYNYYLEQQALRKKNEKQKTKEIVNRFCPRNKFNYQPVR